MNTGVFIGLIADLCHIFTDGWHKPQKRSELCGIRIDFWIIIHGKSMKLFLLVRKENLIIRGAGHGYLGEDFGLDVSHSRLKE